MDIIDIFREFFGWCAVINIGLLMVSTVLVVLLRGVITRIHGSLFNLDEQSLSEMYMQYLAQYKIATIVLSIVPYFALFIMS